MPQAPLSEGQACRAVRPRRGRPQDGADGSSRRSGVRSAARQAVSPKLQGAGGIGAGPTPQISSLNQRLDINPELPTKLSPDILPHHSQPGLIRREHLIRTRLPW
jgi:hypothetical protein